MPMFIQQSDLFNGVSSQFFKTMMDVSVKESHADGDILFRRGDPADHFYVLITGSIQLTDENPGEKKIYTGDRTGEAFGWSSLIDRQLYSASARCMAPTVLLKFKKERLLKVIEDDPVNGIIFYKYLSQILCHRLLKSYQTMRGNG